MRKGDTQIPRGVRRKLRKSLGSRRQSRKAGVKVGKSTRPATLLRALVKEWIDEHEYTR